MLIHRTGDTYCKCNVAVTCSLWFLARDSMLSALYAIARPSVRPSVTRVDQSKTAETITKIFSPYGSPNIVVFCDQGVFRKSDGFPLSDDAKQGWGGKNQPFSSFMRQYLENGRRYDYGYY